MRVLSQQAEQRQRQRVLALTDQVMSEHAHTLERLGSWSAATTLPDGNEVEVIAPGPDANGD